MDKKRVLTVGAITAALVIPTVGIAVAQSAYEPVETEILAAAYRGSAGENGGQRGQGQGRGQGGMMRGGGQGHDHSGEQGEEHDHEGGQGGGHGQGGMMGGGGQGGGHGKGGGQMALATEPTGELSDELKDQLILLAEEEQVAHDLYVLADDKYGSDTNTYGNISQAETRHFTAMNRLLDLYGLDSATEMGDQGKFDSPNLQVAYDSLAGEIKESAEAAAAVGVKAEETDIADLKEALDMKNVPTDVERVLSNLVRASENHLSAFTNLQNQL